MEVLSKAISFSIQIQNFLFGNEGQGGATKRVFARGCILDLSDNYFKKLIYFIWTIIKIMATAGQSQVYQQEWKEPPENINRAVGVAILVTQVGSMVAYGVVGRFFNETGAVTVAEEGIFYTMMLMLFTIVGFGLLLNVFKFGTWLGAGTAILVAAVSIQFSPLLQKFWFSVFITGFSTQPDATQVGSQIQDYWRHYQSQFIAPSYYMQQTTMIGCISLLTAMTAFIGRIDINQVLKLTSFFTVFWNMNYYVLIRIFIIVNDFNTDATPQFAPFFFDSFGSSYVYLFGAVFGLVYSCFLAKQRFPIIHPSNEHNRISMVLSAMGTAFIFATFVFSSNNFYQASGNSSSISRLAIIFALTGSVIGTYVGSALAGKGKVGYKEALVGTITGGVVIASTSAILTNIGIIIMIGFVASFICGIYMRTVHLKVNKEFTYDALGLFGPFLIASFLGSFVVTPSVLAYYYNNSIIFPTIGVLVPLNLPGWSLVFTGVTAGSALVSGIFCGLLSLCDHDFYGLGSNSRYFANQFGLYSPGEDDYVQSGDNSESAKQLN